MRASVFLALAAVPALVSAQNFFELSTGERHEGKIAGTPGNTRLETAMGRLELGANVKLMRRNPFESHASVALAEEALNADYTAGQIAVAEYAAANGVWAAARRHLNRALELDPDNERALGLAAKWADRFQLSVYEAAPKPNPRKALEEWLKDAAARDWVGAAMVDAKARKIDSELLLHPMLKALKSDKASARWCAARSLTNLRSEPERIKPLYRRGVLDPVSTVRTECVRALKVTKDPAFCRLYARALGSKSQAIRISAANALAELELPEGAEPLVRVLSGETPCCGPRNHIIQTTQVAYVKDFDVEVAQNAVIADPIVDVVQDGVVLDVAVCSIQGERHVYFGALRRITRQDFGQDLSKWRQYLKMKAAEEPTSGG
jgi:hypothetical protein